MKFSILSEMDRLASMLMKEPMKTVPVLDVQKQLDDDYRDQIEILNLKLLDQEDTIKLLTDINERLRQREKQSQERITSYQATLNENSFATARCTSLESQVKKLEADLKTETGNRDHFRQLVAQQDAFITEAKRQIAEFKNKKEAELKAKTGEAEHLAKQAIRLNEENSKLLKDNAEIRSRSNQLNEQTPLLMEENRKFREQTTRLIEEKRKLEEQVNQYECWGCRSGQTGEYCGGCLGCLMRQAEHNMNMINKDYIAEQKVNGYRASIIDLFTHVVDALKDWPILQWRSKAKVIADCNKTVSVLNSQIDHVRDEQKKG